MQKLLDRKWKESYSDSRRGARLKSPPKPGRSVTEMEKYQLRFLESEKETFICNGSQIFPQDWGSEQGDSGQEEGEASQAGL